MQNLPQSEPLMPSFYGPDADARADGLELTDDDFERLAIANGIHNVIATYGLPRFLRWTRNIALSQGLDYDTAIRLQAAKVNR